MKAIDWIVSQFLVIVAILLFFPALLLYLMLEAGSFTKQYFTLVYNKL